MFKAQSLRSHLPLIQSCDRFNSLKRKPSVTPVNAKTAKKEEGVGKKEK
ncbi:hypothetical protein [Fischerella thermalis]|nr:hypothetical protein [Fischerella thermalis]